MIRVSPASMKEAERLTPTAQGPPPSEVHVRASLIIVNFNGGESVLRCLRSVAKAMGSDVELIVVDNGSTDGSAEAIEERFPEARLVRSEANLGFGAGCNFGARRARGEYVAFLNPDIRVEAGWLERLLAPLQADPSVGMVTAKVLLADPPDRINTCGLTVHLTGLSLCRGLGQPRHTFGQGEEVAAVSGAAFAMRRDRFEALGGFDEDFFLYMEDTDLSWRARLRGWRCRYVPESVVWHDYRLRFTPRKVFYQERNRYLMLLKSLRWPTLLALLPALLLAEAVTWGFVLLRDRGNLANKLRAYGWIIAHWARVRRKRAAAQALRTARDRDLLGQTGFALDLAQTAPGWAARAASAVFEPVFFVLRALALAVVWW